MANIQRRSFRLVVVALVAGTIACSNQSPGTDGAAGARGDGSDDSDDSGGGPPPSVVGTILACPGNPTGSCSVDGQTCEYPTQTCLCDAGAWTCTACPASQPSTTDTCPFVNGSLPFRCGYGGLTCSCGEDVFRPFGDWSCGFCPATPPTMSEACGNTIFSCVYDDQTCTCYQSWSCAPRACPEVGDYVDCRGAYTCKYPELDQTCNCQGGSPFMECTCPAALPAQGSACQGIASGCKYGEQTCDCSGGWKCVAACPDAMPVAGSACSSALTCSYDSGLCYCMDGTWHC